MTSYVPSKRCASSASRHRWRVASERYAGTTTETSTPRGVGTGFVTVPALWQANRDPRGAGGLRLQGPPHHARRASPAVAPQAVVDGHHLAHRLPVPARARLPL